jgi:hypothetical protein
MQPMKLTRPPRLGLTTVVPFKRHNNKMVLNPAPSPVPVSNLINPLEYLDSIKRYLVQLPKNTLAKAVRFYQLQHAVRPNCALSKRLEEIALEESIRRGKG